MKPDRRSSASRGYDDSSFTFDDDRREPRSLDIRSDGNKLAIIGLLLIGVALFTYGMIGSGAFADTAPGGPSDEDLAVDEDDDGPNPSSEDVNDTQEDENDDADEPATTDSDDANESFVGLSDVEFWLDENAVHFEWEYEVENEDLADYEIRLKWESEHPWKPASDEGEQAIRVSAGEYSQTFDGDECSIGSADLLLVEIESERVVESHVLAHDLDCSEPTFNLTETDVWIDAGELHVTWEYEAENVDPDEYVVEIAWEISNPNDAADVEHGADRVAVNVGEYATPIRGDDCWDADVHLDVYSGSDLEESHNLSYEPDCPEEEEDDDDGGFPWFITPVLWSAG